jgi:hypothetical protein
VRHWRQVQDDELNTVNAVGTSKPAVGDNSHKAMVTAASSVCTYGASFGEECSQ